MTEKETQILQQNIQNILYQIEAACTKSDRPQDAVRLVAVTKYVDATIARGLFDLGLSDFGENRIQVAEPKLNALSDLPIRWHWIGNLQTNKARKVIGRFQEFHSIDRIPLIEAIEERLGKHPEQWTGDKIPAYLQINVSGEKTKSGFSVEEATGAGERILGSEYLEWVGLMTMAPHDQDLEKTRPIFAQLRECRDSLEKKLGVSVPRLSMGMSHDFQVAIEEGATDVRIGSLLYEGLVPR